MTPPDRPSPLREQAVVDRVKDYILAHELRPGDPMPTEAELGEAIGVGRSSVREAMRTLRALDIVRVRHGYGTTVGGLSMAALVESLAFRGMLTRSDDYRLLSDLVQVRTVLETGLAGAIIDAMTPDVAAGLRHTVDDMFAAAGRGEDLATQDRAFHLMLTEPLGNDLVVQLTGAFWDVHALIGTGAAPDDLIATAGLHERIVAAVTDKDADALRDAVDAHYRPVLQRIEALRDR